MPTVADIISINLVQELSGVQMSNKVYFRVDDLGDTPTSGTALVAIMTEYHDAIKAALAAAWTLVCGIYVNETAVEAKAIAFTTLVGTSIVDSHPQDQPLRLNRYGVSVAPAPVKIRTAGFNQSGVSEDFSSKGRINDTSEFLALRNFLRSQTIFGTGWTLTPQMKVREQTLPPFTFQFIPVEQCLINTQFKKLRSRKTNLCIA